MNFHIRASSWGPNYLDGRFYAEGEPRRWPRGENLRVTRFPGGVVVVEVGARRGELVVSAAEADRPLTVQRARVLVGDLINAYEFWGRGWAT